MGKVLAKVTTSTLAGSKSSRVCIPVSQMIPWSQHLEALLFGSLSIEKAVGNAEALCRLGSPVVLAPSI